MHEDAMTWLQTARGKLSEAGFQPIAVVALDRPTLSGRIWTDGTLQSTQVQDLLATYAAELTANGVLDGARLAAPFSRQLASGTDRAVTVFAVPRGAPRIAAVVRGSAGADLNAAMQAAVAAVPRDTTLEIAASLCEVTGASAVLMGTNVEFASRAAFVQQGATGPFLGLTCLSRQALEAVARLQRATQEGGAQVRRERVGDLTMACFVRRIGENNLAIAASRFGLTRAELAEAESMIAGLSCKESASRLKISPETVRQRRKVIYRKLGVESCGTAVARILELELPGAPAEGSGSANGSPRPGAGREGDLIRH